MKLYLSMHRRYNCVAHPSIFWEGVQKPLYASDGLSEDVCHLAQRALRLPENVKDNLKCITKLTHLRPLRRTGPDVV